MHVLNFLILALENTHQGEKKIVPPTRLLTKTTGLLQRHNGGRKKNFK
jgi:hypothetical protein